jgi:hypothetical protein
MSYKKALKKIRDNCGKVCEQYEICDHDACQSSYNSWAIADEALKQGNPWWRIWVIGMVFLGVIFTTLALSEIHHNKKLISNLESRIETLEKDSQEASLQRDIANRQFVTYRKMTSDEFERTWKSFGIIRNNFLALGHGFHLCDEDIAPNEAEKE